MSAEAGPYPAPAACGGKKGTYAGWNAHRHAGEGSCDVCKAAQRVYVRNYRQVKATRCVRGLGWPAAS